MYRKDRFRRQTLESLPDDIYLTECARKNKQEEAFQVTIFFILGRASDHKIIGHVSAASAPLDRVKKFECQSHAGISSLPGRSARRSYLECYRHRSVNERATSAHNENTFLGGTEKKGTQSDSARSVSIVLFSELKLTWMEQLLRAVAVSSAMTKEQNFDFMNSQTYAAEITRVSSNRCHIQIYMCVVLLPFVGMNFDGMHACFAF